MRALSKKLAETEAFARQTLIILAQTDREGATLLGLSGELGAGKTTFTQIAAKILAVRGVVQSPTFVLLKNYPIPEAREKKWPWRRLIHFDCYRLANASELLVLGWAELMADSGNLILLEWPERVIEALPPDLLRIKFEIINDTSRRLTLC